MSTDIGLDTSSLGEKSVGMSSLPLGGEEGGTEGASVLPLIAINGWSAKHSQVRLFTHVRQRQSRAIGGMAADRRREYS